MESHSPNVNPSENVMIRKSILLTHIHKAPGIKYRELLQLTGLGNGVLSYYLKNLEKSKCVKVKRTIKSQKSNMTRYFPLEVTNKECLIIGNIRRNTTKQIILFILEHNNNCTFNEIVEHTNKSPSTISWQLNRLKDAGILTVHNRHQYQIYKVRNIVTKLLNKYNDRILDNITDNDAESSASNPY